MQSSSLRLYHGTSPKSAESITNGGVQLLARHTDFAIKGAFYLCDNADDAALIGHENMVLSGSGSEPVHVLVFEWSPGDAKVHTFSDQDLWADVCIVVYNYMSVTELHFTPGCVIVCKLQLHSSK
jgi:hypothetical protein